jgi:tetratricopeptide (TPR) repeat protein
MLRRAIVVCAALAILAVEACNPHDRTPPRDTTTRGDVAPDGARLLAAGDSQYFGGAYDSARTTFEHAAAAARGDSTVVARALTSLGLVAWKQGRFDDAKSIGERALALKQRIGLKAELARSFNALGMLANDRGELDEAVQRLSDARTAAEGAHDSFAAAKARGNLGLALQNMGDFDRARVEFGALHAGAVAAHDRRIEANALNNLGMLETRVGNPLAAIDRLTSARAIYASLDYTVGIENALGQLGVAYAELGETARALAYLDSALNVATKAGLKEPRPMTSSSWGICTSAPVTIAARSISSTAPECQANRSECSRSSDTSRSAKRTHMRRWGISCWLGRARVKPSTVKRKPARAPRSLRHSSILPSSRSATATAKAPKPH